jgi:hypothetical protein
MINSKIFVPFSCQFRIKKTHTVFEKNKEREVKGKQKFFFLIH